MSILFQDRHLPLIREGAKTATRRDWAENYGRPKPGRVYGAVTEMFVEAADVECWIRISDVYRQPLGEMTGRDFDAEGGYSEDEFREIWVDLHGDWDPDLVVDVVEFVYVGDSVTRCLGCGNRVGDAEAVRVLDDYDVDLWHPICWKKEREDR